MIDIDQMTADIAQGEPVPRIITIRAVGDVVELAITLAHPADPQIYADHIIYAEPALHNPKINAYVRRFMRMGDMERAVIDLHQPA